MDIKEKVERAILGRTKAECVVDAIEKMIESHVERLLLRVFPLERTVIDPALKLEFGKALLEHTIETDADLKTIVIETLRLGYDQRTEKYQCGRPLLKLADRLGVPL